MTPIEHMTNMAALTMIGLIEPALTETYADRVHAVVGEGQKLDGYESANKLTNADVVEHILAQYGL